ncbi:MAG TPA: hypothetical protein VGG35_26100 [Streptosporangiaceae bacterium]|jgi:hypothetical protein
MKPRLKTNRSPRIARLTVGAVAVAGLTAGLFSIPLTASAAASASCTAGEMSCTPASGTPHLLLGTSSTNQIRQLVQCGSEMYAVGTFTQVVGYDAQTKTTKTYHRTNAFKFHASAPFSMSGWNPAPNGRVNSIAVGGKNCSTAYLGGSFSSVHGTAASNVAEVSTSTGAVNTNFRHSANGQVETLLLHDGRLLTGGYFTSINGSSRKYYVALNSSTGVDDGYLNLNISGHYVFTSVSTNNTRVYNQQLSHAGHRLVAEGDFTSVGGKSRRQIFMLSLGTSHATVTGWTSPEFSANCYRTEPFWLKAAAWGPTDRTVFVATTGYHPAGGQVGATSTRTGLCDAAAKFEATEKSVTHRWVNYTGCDSLYAAVAGSSTLYVGGHERWADNGDGCDAAGPGAIAAPGMAGLGEVSHQVEWNPTRARGLGADDMLLTSAGLWIASDNFNGSDQCGGVTGHSGICFMPKS